jgi:hypothetical protein
MVTLLLRFLEVPFLFLQLFTFTHLSAVGLLVVHLSEAAFVDVLSVAIPVLFVMRVVPCDLTKLFLPASFLGDWRWRSASTFVFVMMGLLFGLVVVLLFVKNFFLISLLNLLLFFFQLLLLHSKFLLQLFQTSLHSFSFCSDVFLLSQFLHLLNFFSFVIPW